MLKTKVFVINGISESGKTTKIKLIAEKLINKGAKVIYQKELSYPNGTDFWYILEYKQKILAITTQGDSERDLKQWYEYMQKNLRNYSDKIDFDYYICACRTKGKTINFLNEIFNGYEKIYHSSWYVNKGNLNKDDEIYDIANEVQANGIIKIIESTF